MESRSRESTSGDWRDKANCLMSDPELFFPVGNVTEAIDKAKAVCAKCRVAEQCLKYALDSKQDSGIWGGMTEDERRALKRRTYNEARNEERRAKIALQDFSEDAYACGNNQAELS
jgi:WhiB family redox-sensing transcriptional regulator